ncbi:MAG: tRNA (N(6)-L-threonylcarbamoyladenosine(37)-C(2))-methylthiotransferase MtaB [Lachnospiraceae bacterium]|nr:tRNA (N(6)-L-threonylcarbamoyladenosine(37)-C(2))-methylthiotransferase MtaB [Lachnospiraceae bacterium]
MAFFTEIHTLKVAFLTLGCKVNQYETDAMKEQFKRAGAKIVSFRDKADVYIINTCSVTNVADKKSRQMLHRAKKKNPQSMVVAVGCYVQAAKEKLKEDSFVDLIVGNNKKKDIVSIVADYLDHQQRSDHVLDIHHVNEFEEMGISHIEGHTRAYIKVQDGCNQFCSYCIIPYARGRVRSRKLDDVILEIKHLVQQGIKEFVLTGIHLSSYGVDQEDMNLLSLIQEVAKIQGVLRIRLGSLEPGIITEEFVQEIVKIPQLCPHFHLSLQSACNDTLKRMNRKYTIEEYKDKCNLLRKYYDFPAITTDVIVGFPGETEEEFAITKRNLEELNLYEIHVFKYSKRKGTRAETMPNQVDDSKKHQRSQELLEMTGRQKSDYEKKLCGETVSVLLEETVEIDGIVYYTGHTMNYVKIGVIGKYLSSNQLVEAIITDYSAKDFLIAKSV